jgi:hypothetical protein
MYKLIKNFRTNEIDSVARIADGSCIPFDPDNTDYQTFKKDLANAVALSDAEGTAMTADQIKTFLETLP